MAFLIAVQAKKTGPPPIYAQVNAKLPPGVIQLTRVNRDTLQFSWRNLKDPQDRNDLLPEIGTTSFTEVHWNTPGRLWRFQNDDRTISYFFYLTQNQVISAREDGLLINHALRTGEDIRGPGAGLTEPVTLAPPLLAHDIAPEFEPTSYLDHIDRNHRKYVPGRYLLVHILNDHIRCTLLNALPDLVRSLAALLLPGMPIRHDYQLLDVHEVFGSRLFHEVIWSLQIALEHHQVPAEMMMQIGLPPDAANGVPQFLQALRSLSERPGDDPGPQTPAVEVESESESEEGERDAEGCDMTAGLPTHQPGGAHGSQIRIRGESDDERMQSWWEREQ